MARNASTSPDVMVGQAAYRALERAAESATMMRASSMGRARVGSLHVLMGLVNEPDTVAGVVLADHQVNVGAIWTAIDFWLGGPVGKTPGEPSRWQRRPHWEPGALDLIERADDEARRRGARVVDTGDLLVANHTSDHSNAMRLLERSGLDAETTKLAVKSAREALGENLDAVPLPLTPRLLAIHRQRRAER